MYQNSYVDLVGKGKTTAKEALLTGVNLESGKPTTQPARPLDQDLLKSFLKCLDSDAKLANIEPRDRYEHVRKALVEYFECNGCRQAEHHADKTIDIGAGKIDSGERIRKDVMSFLIGIARNVLKTYRRNPESSALLFDDDIEKLLYKEDANRYQPDTSYIETGIDSPKLEEIMELCQKKCLRGLPDEVRGLFIKYKTTPKRQKYKIAKQFNIKMGSLKVKTVLEECICPPVECNPVEIPEMGPRFTLRYGEAETDRIDTNDLEVLCLTACNPHSNIIIKDLTVFITALARDGGEIPDLPGPDGMPTVWIKPSHYICFGDLRPCIPDSPNGGLSCVSRELVLSTNSAIADNYTFRITYCYSVELLFRKQNTFRLEIFS